MPDQPRSATPVAGLCSKCPEPALSYGCCRKRYCQKHMDEHGREQLVGCTCDVCVAKKASQHRSGRSGLVARLEADSLRGCRLGEPSRGAASTSALELGPGQQSSGVPRHVSAGLPPPAMNSANESAALLPVSKSMREAGACLAVGAQGEEVSHGDSERAGVLRPWPSQKTLRLKG